MAEFIIRSNLNPNKAVSATITFRQVINKGEEGEPVWVLQIGTEEPHKDGGPIPPTFIHFTDAANLNDAIAEAVTEMSGKIDWSPEREDTRGPFVIYHTPEQDGIASILSDVNIGIKDMVPSAGIDLDSIKMTVNGVDVTDDIDIIGTPTQYSVTWRPFFRIKDYYE
jgi:hypothetical protein